MDETEEVARIIATVCRLGSLAALEAEQDIYDAGLSSLQALGLLVELEEAFEVTIPDAEFITARTVRALHAIIVAAR